MKKDRIGRVLVVDDEVFQTDFLTRVLGDCEVITANDGQTCLELAARESPDLILLDIVMPGLNGFQVCERLKSRPDTRDIPVIFLTGETGPAVVFQAFQAGAVDYIAKPYELSEINERVRTHLELKRSREDLARQNRILEKTVHEQEISINLARDLLRLVNGGMPRYIDLGRDLTLFCLALSRPCHRQGGDHYLVSREGGRTTISLKDQSGHQVGCVLRSIACDFLHNTIIQRHPGLDLGARSALLNRAVIESGSFQGDDFFTAFNLELDHQTLTMRYVNAGHPPLLLIRGGQVKMVPPQGGTGANLPFCVTADQEFGVGELALEPGDRLLLFTDGLTGMPTRKGKRPLSNSELVELVAALLAEQPEVRVTKLIKDILNAVHQFDGGDFRENDTDDDITILGLELESSINSAKEVSLAVGEADLTGLIEGLLTEIRTFLLENAFPVSDTKLQMVVNEAVVNAWRHGCGARPGGRVLVRWWLANDFNLEVVDHGPGFDPELVADPTRAANIGKRSGRGLFIIRKMSSWLRWREGGRRTVISFAPENCSLRFDQPGS